MEIFAALDPEGDVIVGCTQMDEEELLLLIGSIEAICDFVAMLLLLMLILLWSSFQDMDADVFGM